MKYYPAFVNLDARPVLVVGGGSVAERKVEALLQSGAAVRVVSPDLTENLSALALQNRIQYRKGEFAESDLEGVWLVVSATDDHAVNEQVHKSATARRIFCNVVDDRSLCSFIAPAIIARGDIQIAVSTGGASPALAQKIRDEIASLIGPEYADLLELLAEVRQEVMETVAQSEQRGLIFHAIVESDALNLLRSGRREQARLLVRDIVERLITELRANYRP